MGNSPAIYSLTYQQVIDLSKGTIKKISPQLHGTDAKKRREKPFNQYFIDQFAVFCNMLIKKSLSTEVYESTFTLQLHTMLLRIPCQQGQQLNLQQNSRTFEFKTPVNTDFIIYGISNPFFCPKITRVVHQLRMFTFQENLFFSHFCVTAPVFLARFSLFILRFNQNLNCINSKTPCCVLVLAFQSMCICCGLISSLV